MAPKFDIHVARYPDPAHDVALLDIDECDVEAAIEAEGWCGTSTLRGDGAVVVAHGDRLPREARAYLRQA